MKTAIILLLACLLGHAAAHAAPGKDDNIAGANAAALQGPDDAALVGALHEFAYETGGLYALQTSPNRITDITLEAGEVLLSVSAGDTTRWIVGDALSGTGGNQQAHVLVKPNAARLSTNLVIMTDRRVYHVELTSVTGTAMAAVSWRYPRDMTLATTAPAVVEAPQINAVEDLNFGYRIRGDKPDWRPARAFDDGNQVFIEMPGNIESMEAPPLFVIGDEGAELVNYRVRGRFYVVDRLFHRAELRLGDKRRRVVRIERLDPLVDGASHAG